LAENAPQGNRELLCREWSREATMAYFCMSHDTIQRFWERRHKDIKLNKASEADRMVLRIAMEGDAALKRRISDLEDEFHKHREEAKPILDVARAILTLNHIPIPSQELLEKPDPLKLTDLGKKSRKYS